jgi:hypothetical protein
MGIPDRVYQLARGYLDRAVSRWDELDSQAKNELDQSIEKIRPGGSNEEPSEIVSSIGASSAWDRAQAKIQQTKVSNDLSAKQKQPALPPQSSVQADECLDALGKTSASGSNATALPGGPTASAIDGAYKMLGLASGADILSVQRAYEKLKERAAPERFAEGSAERQKATQIERRASAAYMLLSDLLAPANDRFDRLEL